MTYTYAFIAAFMFGIYIGAAYERGEKPEPSDILPLVMLSVLWPLVLSVLFYTRITRKAK